MFRQHADAIVKHRPAKRMPMISHHWNSQSGNWDLAEPADVPLSTVTLFILP
jgi:hypothetical protein